MTEMYSETSLNLKKKILNMTLLKMQLISKETFHNFFNFIKRAEYIFSQFLKQLTMSERKLHTEREK